MLHRVLNNNKLFICEMETNDTQEESICVETETLPTNCPRVDDPEIFPPTEGWIELKLGVCNRPDHRVHLVEAIVVDGCPTVIKSATIDFLQATVTKYMLGKLCDQANTGIANPQTFSTIAEANKMLRDFATQDVWNQRSCIQRFSPRCNCITST